MAEGPAASASWGQLAILFGYALVNWSIGNGLLPILPSIAVGFGADLGLTGLYLAASYVALAAGTVVAGFLADRGISGKRFLLVASLANVLLLLLLSAVATLWELAVLTASVWCLAGMSLTLVTIQAGMAAGSGERGRVLGFLAQAAPLGSIVGGFGIGALADVVGYRSMWIALGLVLLACPVLAALLRETPRPLAIPRSSRAVPRMVATPAFAVLILCGVLSAFGSFVAALGRSFAMASYSNEAITSTAAVSGLVALPFTLLMGWMSDRIGRLPFMAICYALGTTGLVLYSGAASLVGFWLAASLVAFISYVSTGVGSALVVDLVDSPSVGRGLAYFGATGWTGAVLGFGLGSLAFSRLGLPDGFLAGAAVSLAALLLLAAIRVPGRVRRTRRPPNADGPANPRKE